MTQPSLLPVDAPRPFSASSRSAFLDVLKDLPLRDLLMVAHVDDYVTAHARFGYTDVTGLELASWLGRSVLGVRPRLTGAKNAGWLTVHELRKSREPGEKACQPYAVAVPRAAINRAIAVAKGSHISSTKAAKVAASGGIVKAEPGDATNVVSDS